MFRFKYFFILGVFLTSIAVSFLPYWNARGASPFDAAITSTDTLFVRPASCELSGGFNATDDPYGWLSVENLAGNGTVTQEVKASFQIALNTGSVLVLNRVPDGTANQEIEYIWSEEKVTRSDLFNWHQNPNNQNSRTLSFNFDPASNQMIDNRQFNVLRVTRNLSSENCSATNSWSTVYTMFNKQQYGVFMWNSLESLNGRRQSPAFANTFPVTYPDGYDGQTLPNSNSVGFVPQYVYTVDTTGLLRLSYSGNASVNLDGTASYRLTKLDDNWSGTPQQLDYRTEKPFWQSKYVFDKLPNSGYYRVVVEYSASGNEITAPPGFDTVEKVTFEIYWNGKDFINSNNTGGCERNVCNNTNEGTPLEKAFRSIQVDTFQLTNFVMAPLNFYASLPSYFNACTPIYFTLFNKGIELPCLGQTYRESSLSFAVTMYQVVVNALVCYFIAMNIFRMIKQVNSPKHDGIEVAKL